MSQYFDEENASSQCDEKESAFEQEKACDCDKNCDCDGDCRCNDKNKCSEDCDCDKEKCECHKNECECGDNCDCENNNCGCKDGKECSCGDNCQCEDCTCGDDTCKKQEDDENCSCCDHEQDKSIEYLNLAKQIQADFDNFRRHAVEDIKQARLSGQSSVIEIFLPCLDTFKEAKKSITDENVLKGVEMIENNINSALEKLGVEKIESIGEKYNPHIHNVIAVMKDETKENDIILDEYQAGYKFNDKIIRYAKVIVNKKED